MRDVHLEKTGQWAHLPRRLQQLSDSWAIRHPGEASGRKVSLRGFRAEANEAERVVLVVDETEWSEVQPLHEALGLSNGKGLRAELMSHLLDPTDNSIPNIASVHGLIETEDGMLVIAQRSREARYHPLHWSASFEEQLEPTDLTRGGAAFHAAAVRGVEEEFLWGGALDLSSCRLLSLIVEYGILNPAVLAHIRIPYPSAVVLESWRNVAPDAAEFDSDGVRFVPFCIETLAPLMLSPGFTAHARAQADGKWHPTARYRILLGMMHKFGAEETYAALEAHDPR